MQVLIRQAKIVDPRSDLHNQVADLLIENGSISDIGKNLKAKPKQIVEAEDLYVSPGWVDVFADYREPGYEQKETITTGLNAAAAGGFTDVLLAPNTNPTVSTKSIVEFVQNKARGHIVNLHPMGSLTQNIEGKNLSEMLDMRAQGAVAFTDGWKPVQNTNLVLKAFEYLKAFNGVLLQVPSDEALSAGGLMHEGPVSTRLGMAGIPSIAEHLALHRDIELLRYTGSRLHVTGISSAESVDMIRRAKKDKLDITCSVTPYHLALNDEHLESYSSLYKVTPPLRTEADRQALVAGLKDGTIDCIASHHRPQEWDAKAKEFEYAADGMNIQEIAFQIIWQAVAKKVGIERLVDAIAIQPRKIFGLAGEPVQKGCNNLTVFTTSGTHTFDKKKMQSASANNPFDGTSFTGRVVAVINNKTFHINK